MPRCDETFASVRGAIANQARLCSTVHPSKSVRDVAMRVGLMEEKPSRIENDTGSETGWDD
jgi:hypothetical protein